MRLYVDYRGMNKVATQIQYHIPHLDDLLHKIRFGKSKVLSKLDLMKGYYQVLLDDFLFKTLPFGLKNALAIFQKC